MRDLAVKATELILDCELPPLDGAVFASESRDGM
jgi:hypothetical protein